MRKFLVCAGMAPTLIVGGATGVHAAYAPDLNAMETSKMWSVSGTLRGFYDDNYNTAPSGPLKRNSFGFELSPSLSLNVPLQQTEFGLSYTYGLYYYQDRMSLGGRPIDQTHLFNIWLDHAFSERWQTKVQDSLAVGQEPDLVNQGQTVRISGNNLHNSGSVDLNTQWTRLLGTKLSYANNIYHYQNSFYQGLLDLMQHDISLDGNWALMPDDELIAFLGYQFEQINYTGNEIIVPGPVVTHSDNRDNRSHFVYLGAQYKALENLAIVGKAGIQYVDYYNPAPTLSSTTTVSPYADLSATYTYLPGSYVQLGFTQTRNATDVPNPTAGGQVTLDQESSVVYGALNHQITPKITGSLTGKIQYSTYHGGAFDGKSQTWYSLGLNLAYAFNPHVSAEAGYNFDDLTSNVAGQQYKRNRVYLGITGTY